MTQVSELSAAAGPLALIPRELAATMRPQLDSLATEIITEIRRTVPEYARSMDGPYGQMLRRAVHEMITAFVDQVADPTISRDPLDQLCRELGRIEAREGRDMSSLHAAYGVGARVAWRRVTEAVQEHDITPLATSLLAQGLFAHMDRLADESWAGFLAERAKRTEAVARWRLQLVRLILDDQPAPPVALNNLASRARWPVPEVVTPLTVRTCGELHGSLPEDALPDLARPDPYLVLAGELDEDRVAELREVFPDGRFVIGLPVPLIRARDSLRWARRALELADTGLIPADETVTWCGDHLLALLLTADEALTEQIARRELAMLDDMTKRQSRVMRETLATWLATRGDARRTAKALGVHPQTVRYRRRQLDELVGDRLDDPETRLLTELALRSWQMHEGDDHGDG